MITTSLLTIRNIIIIWNIYHYFLYAHTIYKGFYYINQRMGGVKDHHTDVDRRTEEFILDELDRTDPKKMGS